MRLFLAVEIPEDVQGELAALQQKLKPSFKGVKWVNSHLLHITLKFLGEVDERQSAAVAAAAQAVARTNSHRPIVGLGEIGTFASRGRIRTVWVGFGRGEGELATLARELEEGLANRGLPPARRPWVPHVTLGRLRKGTPTGAVGHSPGRAGTPSTRHQWQVNSFVLMRSQLSQQGPTYTCLRRFHLGKDRDEERKRKGA